MTDGFGPEMFVVDNPNAKPGLRRILNQERKRAGVSRRETNA